MYDHQQYGNLCKDAADCYDSTVHVHATTAPLNTQTMITFTSWKQAFIQQTTGTDDIVIMDMLVGVC